jgi:hypothetical protein
MYFSGNDQHTEQGNWRTGLAIASSPVGPFRVTTLKGDYLNGGTTVWHGRLWHLVERNPDLRGELAVSRDGVHWAHVSYLPSFTSRGSKLLGADFFLEPQGGRLGAYMLMYPPSGGIGRSLGYTTYFGGRWAPLRLVLPISAVAADRWASADLGEPSAFSWGGRRYMLFVGLQLAGRRRTVGLAVRANGGFRVCGIAFANNAPWGTASAIDPTPLVQGRRLYVYYGATRTNGLAADLGGAIGVREFSAAPDC